MTFRPVIFHPGVEDDLASIYDHYRALDSSLPGRFESRLADQVQRIETFPESGAFVFDSYRRVLVRRFPYMAVYVIRDDRIHVVAVIGTQRDPASIEATVLARGGA